MLNRVKLKELRKSKGIRQEDIAEYAEVTQNYYSQIETGGRTPSMKVLDKIAEYLEVNVSDLLNEQEPELNKSKEESHNAMVLTSLGEIFNMLEKYAEQPLSEKDKRAFKKILRIVEEKYLDDITPGGID